MRRVFFLGHRSVHALSAAALLVLVAACATFLPGTVTISREQIDTALARRFPYRASLLGVFTVDVQPPRLHFLADVDRLGADFDVTLAERLGGNVYHGRLNVDGSLRYEAADHTLRLADARVRSFSVDALPRDLQSLVDGYGGLLTSQVVGDVTLYALKPDQIARLEESGLRPGAIHVTPFGVTVALDEHR